jgi:5-methylcytosine-specific restriction endonuclease McrA
MGHSSIAIRRGSQWGRRSNEYRASVRWTCEWCGTYTPSLIIHHLTYERAGAELDEDLVGLCTPCHTLAHFPHYKHLRTALAWRREANGLLTS